MIGMASVVTRSPLIIASKNKSERMKENTRLLPTTTTTTSISISLFSSSYSDWHIPFPIAKTRLKCRFSDDASLDARPSGVHDEILTGFGTANKETAFDDVGKANRKDPHQNAKVPSPEECIHTLNEMHLFETRDRLYIDVAHKIFRKSEAHRKKWMQLCQEQQQKQQQEQEIVIKNWIESSKKELGFY